MPLASSGVSTIANSASLKFLQNLFWTRIATKMPVTIFIPKNSCLNTVKDTSLDMGPAGPVWPFEHVIHLICHSHTHTRLILVFWRRWAETRWINSKRLRMHRWYGSLPILHWTAKPVQFSPLNNQDGTNETLIQVLKKI